MTGIQTRKIEIHTPVEPKSQPRLRRVRATKITDYPGVSGAYKAIARQYSNPLLFGPPICDELMALVQHMFTEEEASLVQHLKFPRGSTAQSVAATVNRPVDEVRSVLDGVIRKKHIVPTFGKGDGKRYGWMPIVPGVFESVLVRKSMDSLTGWHSRFAELFSALYETGYFGDYADGGKNIPVVRYLPVNQTIEAHSMALPFDRLAEVLDPYQSFAVGLCQCRMTEEIIGKGCGRSMENCVTFGNAAEGAIRNGRMRRADKHEVLDIKAQAEADGLVTFIAEIDTGKATSGASCSCCGCCCHALRTIGEFNAPGLIAPPHFSPQVNQLQCNFCGKCAKACPVGAMAVDAKGKQHHFFSERCIGCGLCAVACDRQQAITMDATLQYRKPPRTTRDILVQMAPNYLRNTFSVWRNRR